MEQTLENLEAKVRARTRALAESEARFRELFDNMSAGVAIYTSPDDGSRFVFKEINRAGLLFCRKIKEAVIGREVREVFPGIESLGLFAVLERVWKTGEPENYPSGHYSDDKLELWVENYVYKLPSNELVAIFTDITGQKQAESRLAESEEKFRSLVESSSDLVWEVDRNWRYTYLSPGVKTIVGFASEELTGHSFFHRMHDRCRRAVENRLNRFKENTAPFSGIEYVKLHRDGSEIIVESSGSPYFSANGGFLGYRGICRDITERKQNEENLLLTDSVFKNTIEGIAVTDGDGRILRVNDAFTAITGYDESEVLGRNPNILKSNRHTDDFYRSMWEAIVSTGHWSGEIWNRRKDGSIYPEWLSISAIRDIGGETKNYVSLFHDISDKKMQEERLQFLSFHDPLTRLPNRKLFYDRAKVALRNAKRAGEKIALLYLDLDNFKNINDSYGHPFGDDVLCLVKDRIASICREVDTFARYGGDEFAIILNHIRHAGDVTAFTARIIQLFESPFTLMDEEVYSSVSIGISIFPDDGEDIVTLEKNADMALFEAKKEGKKRSFLFKKSISEKLNRKTFLENEMRKSAHHFHAFHIVYQPKVHLKDNCIRSVEALLRWEVDGRSISPAEFIPIAEETNLIIPIGRWLMAQAMADIKSIHDHGFADLSLSINLSGKQFTDDHLLDTIRNCLDRCGYSPSRLCFEITESIPMEDTVRAIGIMKQINQLGIQLSMDDFGTGYSSLSVLKRFPLRELKIDRSFITGLPDDPDDVAITRTIIQLARGLNFDIVAEGVETEDQLLFLKQYGCDIIQGYLFYRPLTLEDLSGVLNTGRQQPV